MEAVQAQSTEALESRVEELESTVMTLTETLILFQEFFEAELGEIPCFRESGSHHKLVETLNKMRVKALKVASSHVKQSPVSKLQYRRSTEMTYEGDDDEQVEVDVDYTDDDPVDEITIRQVYSVPSPEKEAAENLLKMSNSAITITPVYAEEKKREPFVFSQPQSAVMMVERNHPTTTPQFLSADGGFMTADNQRIILPALKLETKENERVITNNNGNSNFGPATVLSPAQPLSLAKLAVPPQVVSTNMQQPNKKSTKKSVMKKSLLRINNPKPLKKKIGKSDAKKWKGNHANGIDGPLNLKKKLRRKSDCPVSCDICGKSYSSKGVMSRHIKEAHKEEPQFPCFYCPVKFRNGPARLEHMNVHHPDDMKCVICPYCERKSSSVAGKRNHMMLCARKHRIGLGNLPQAVTTNRTVALSTDSGMRPEVSSFNLLLTAAAQQSALDLNTS